MGMMHESTVEAVRPPSARPGRRAASGESMRRFDSYVRAVAPGDVGKLVPNAQEGTFGLRVRLRRAATRQRLRIESWEVGGVVYFRRRLKPTNRARRLS